MKKNLFILLVTLLAFAAPYAVADVAANETARRDDMVKQYLNKKPLTLTTAEDFLRAAKEGNVAAISKLQNAQLLSATDKFGNNCFHLAKDAATLQALAGVVRRSAPAQAAQLIADLRNQRNEMGETPLMAHINYGKADTFFLLYTGSELELSIRKVREVNYEGAISTVADIKKGVVTSLSKDNSGRTVAQAAVAQAQLNQPGMAQIVAFFQANAPYLF